MIYHSTRNKDYTANSAQAVLEGLAPDGGLYMPDALPPFDWQACLQGSAMDMSTAILSALLPEIPNMPALVKAAYTDKFETKDLTPTVSAGDFHVLELFRGPTAAFKDVALSILPHLLTTAKKQCGVEEDILILTATSGDTGKAALGKQLRKMLRRPSRRLMRTAQSTSQKRDASSYLILLRRE